MYVIVPNIFRIIFNYYLILRELLLGKITAQCISVNSFFKPNYVNFITALSDTNSYSSREMGREAAFLFFLYLDFFPFFFMHEVF